MNAWAYWNGEAYVIGPEPRCDPDLDVRWATHPWTQADPKLPTYQVCPRCLARRVAIPEGLARVAMTAHGV